MSGAPSLSACCPAFSRMLAAHGSAPVGATSRWVATTPSRAPSEASSSAATRCRRARSGPRSASTVSRTIGCTNRPSASSSVLVKSSRALATSPSGSCDSFATRFTLVASPRIAVARATASAFGESWRMRAVTVRATVVFTACTSSRLPVNGAALSSSVSSSGLPRVVSKQAATNSGSASRLRSMSAFTPVSESAGSRSNRVAGAVARLSNRPGPAGRAAMRSSTGRSSTRRASASRNRRLGASAQCASSTTSSSGCSRARFAAKPVEPVERRVRGVVLLRRVGQIEHRLRELRRAPEQPLPVGLVHLAVEQLPHDPEREVALQRRAGRAQHLRVGRGDALQHPQQRGLPVPGRSLHQRHRPARRPRLGELRDEPVQLRPALEQRVGAGRSHWSSILSGAQPSHAAPSPSRSSPYGSSPTTWTGPV